MPSYSSYFSDIVRKKFNNLSNYYTKERKKLVKHGGGGGEAVPKWEMYRTLQFLDKAAQFSSTTNNLKTNLSNVPVSTE